MKHYNVAVLRGGPSSEYEVSLKTGAGVLRALGELGVKTRDITINRQGEWLLSGYAKEPYQALNDIDVVFIALHGQYGEDGTIQRLLDRFGLPYTGSRALPSSMAMNKVFTKEYLSKHGIKQPPHLRIARSSGDLNRVVLAVDSLFGPHYVVKPVNGGSSIDTYLIEGVAELYKALNRALDKYEEVLVEQRIFGREATVGVLNNYRDQGLYSLPAIEIIPPREAKFFDYQAKYSGETEEICPGRFSQSEKKNLEELATFVHEALGLSHYSRSDFIVADRGFNQEAGIYFLETNTLPGLTPTSLLPKALEAVGCSYNEFIQHLLLEAVKK